MALRGLSSPDTARAGNIYGIAGMAIAILTTLATPQVVSHWLIVLGILIGGAIGTYIARQIQMTALPQLVAGFHSLVGLAAVCVAIAAFAAPEAYGIGVRGEIHGAEPCRDGDRAGDRRDHLYRLDRRLRANCRASSPAGRWSFPCQHSLNAALGFAADPADRDFRHRPSRRSSSSLLVLLSLRFGFLLIVPIGGADMPVVISMLNSYSGWAACGIGFTLSNSLLIITGALVGSSGAILSYIMCKGMNRSIFNVILGGFGGEGTAAPAGPGGGDRLSNRAAPRTRRSS